MSRRSLWRRVARPARRILHRAATLIDPLVHPDPTGLLPPAHLRIYYYGSWAPELVTRAGENARIELMSRGLRPDHRVLDIGSGIGNLALALRDDLTGGYDGLEIHPEAVAWCQGTISPRYPSFRFHRANVASSAYNPSGAEPGGCLQVSLPRPHVRLHPSRVGLHPYAARRAYEESFVEAVHRESHLRIREIRRGQWWSGAAHDQDVLTTGVEAHTSSHRP